jgi:hypothetical protein
MHGEHSLKLILHESFVHVRKRMPNALHLPNWKMFYIIFAKFGTYKLIIKVSKHSALLSQK